MIYYFTPTREENIKSENAKCWWICGAMRLLMYWWHMSMGHKHGKQYSRIDLPGPAQNCMHPFRALLPHYVDMTVFGGRDPWVQFKDETAEVQRLRLPWPSASILAALIWHTINICHTRSPKCSSEIKHGSPCVNGLGFLCCHNQCPFLKASKHYAHLSSNSASSS